jgi:serine/threonine-protein kinase/endoribonuclease IRE1
MAEFHAHVVVRDLTPIVQKHHYQDLPDKVKRNLGPMLEGFLAYFTRRFPRLFLHVHSVVGDTSLRTESMFRSYFELHD